MVTGYPLHRENRGNGPNNSLSGETQGIWKFGQNTGKTRGIWFAQVVNPLVLKVKDISKFAMKNSNILLKLDNFYFLYGRLKGDKRRKVPKQ